MLRKRGNSIGQIHISIFNVTLFRGFLEPRDFGNTQVKSALPPGTTWNSHNGQAGVRTCARIGDHFVAAVAVALAGQVGVLADLRAAAIASSALIFVCHKQENAKSNYDTGQTDSYPASFILWLF